MSFSPKSYRNVFTLIVCAVLSLAAVTPAAVVRAQDATASVLAERAELDKALATDTATRIGLLEKFLAEHPESLLGEQAREALVRSHATVGEVALKAGDPKAAADAFNRAVDSAGENISDRLFRSVIWPMPVVMASAGFRFEAIQLMRGFEKRFEKDGSRLVQIGYFYVSIESPNDAVRVLEQAVALAPTDHSAYSSLGTAYIISLRLDDASTAFAKAIELEPKEEFAYAGLANLRRAFGSPAEAIELYRKQLENKPDDPDSYSGLAMAYLLNDDDTSASQALARSLALTPNNFRLYTQLAYFYVSRNRYDKAREMVDLSMRYEPRFAWTHLVLGNIELGQKRYDVAIKTLLDAQQYGDFPTLHFELAKAYMVDDRFDEAIDELNSSFDITDDGQFETRLGDVLDLRSSKLDLLLERERQAVLFMPIQPTTPTQYRLAESLARIAHFLELIPNAPVGAGTTEVAATPEPEQPAAPVEAAPETKRSRSPEPSDDIIYTEPQSGGVVSPLVFRPRRAATPPAEPAPAEASAAPATDTETATAPEPGAEPAAPPASETPAAPAGSDSTGRAIDPSIREQLAAAVDGFVGVDDGRESFRKLWVARQLAEKGILLDRAQTLAEQALADVETATALDGSVRDLPEADLATRRAVLTARAQGALGWVMLQRGQREEALEMLRKSVAGAEADPERIARLWHLGDAEQEIGNERGALDIYLQAYDPGSPSAPVRRQIIEALYVKVHGSAEGLDQRLTSRP